VDATVVVRKRSSGKRVCSIRTRNGRFRSSLKPGSYRLSAMRRRGSLRVTRVVHVPPHKYVVVLLELGSRLRGPATLR
jgi:hypothetical protein